MTMTKREILFRGWNKKNKKWIYGYGYITADGECSMCDTPRDAFAELINNICGKGTWERNQLVEAYTFTRVD